MLYETQYSFHHSQSKIQLDGFNQIRNEIKRKSATKRLHDDYMKMFNSDISIMDCEKENSNIRNGYE